MKRLLTGSIFVLALSALAVVALTAGEPPAGGADQAAAPACSHAAKAGAAAPASGCPATAAKTAARIAQKIQLMMKALRSARVSNHLRC